MRLLFCMHISCSIIKSYFIQGYKHKRAFIVAEGPMQSTVRNFWKMIYERNCAVVVMTSGLLEGGQEASAQYWPLALPQLNLMSSPLRHSCDRKSSSKSFLMLTALDLLQL